EAPDEDVASFPLNEALKIMGDRSGGWGKWYPEGAGSYRRAQEGQPLDSRYLGNYLPSHVGDPQVVWSIQYVNVVLVSRSQMDQIMDMLVSNFSKPAGIYKPLRRWLHEMDVLALGY
ncbi:MAG: hypothetical protein Q8P59_14085, partial [Dehalococcoidia bacterium]|nr:hypothetical protein [Dehalococcoidia bacterium]